MIVWSDHTLKNDFLAIAVWPVDAVKIKEAKMKKFVKGIVAVSLAVAMSVPAFNSAAVQANALEELEWDSSAEHYIDLDNDGVDEDIYFETTPYYYDGVEFYMNVYINDELVFAGDGEYKYDFLKMPDGNTLIYIGDGDETDTNGDSYIYKYENGDLKELVDIDKLFKFYIGDVENVVVDGNEIYADMKEGDAAGIGFLSMRVALSYNGESITRDGDTYKVLWIQNLNCKKVTKLKTAKKLKLYSDKTGKKIKKTIPAGTTLKIKKRYVSKNYSWNKGFSAYYVEGKGYKGWVNSKGTKLGSYMFKGCMGVG